MAETKSKTEPQVLWGQNHDIFYANAFHFRISDNDISIELGTMQNINDVDGLLSTHQIIMTLKSAKLLSIMLSNTINAIEGQFGEIKIDAARIVAIETATTDGIKKLSDK